MIKSLYPHFQYWSEGGSIWLLGDTHFEDKDCKLIDEKWISPQEQVNIINSKVFKNDTFVHLGDVGNPEWMNKVNARRKILIMGNHDQSIKRFEPYFDEIYSGPLFIGQKILLSHEPILDLKWCINIHGHNHNGNYSDDNWYSDVINCLYHINLAANVCGYTPMNLGAAIKRGLLSNVDSIHRHVIAAAAAKED